MKLFASVVGLNVLTAKGRDLGPIVRAMREWGRKYAR
jgi:DNA-binding HxlR family transcriptional regulator